MITKELSKILRKSAREQKNRLCDEWYDNWDLNGDRQYLIDLYLKGIDFAIDNDWPDNAFIVRNFDRHLLRKNNILVNDKWSVANPKTVVMLGNSISTVRNSGWNVATCYVRHESNATVICKNMSFTTLHVHDNATVKIEIFDKANAVVILHSDKAHVDAPENVRIRRSDAFSDKD